MSTAVERLRAVSACDPRVAVVDTSTVVADVMEVVRDVSSEIHATFLKLIDGEGS
jgi:hypothetical protein